MGSDIDFDAFLEPLTVHAERPYRVVLFPQALYGDAPMALLVRFSGEGNDGFRREWRRLAEQLTAHVNSPALGTLQREALATALAKHVVVGWEGIYGKNAAGAMVPVEFSVDACDRFLTSLAPKKGCADVFDRVFAAAENAANFRDPLPTPQSVGKE